MKKRMMEAARVLFWTVNGLMHLLEDEMGSKMVRTFASHNIFYGGEGMIVIGVDGMGWREEMGVSVRGEKMEGLYVFGDADVIRWEISYLIRLSHLRTN